VNAHGSAVNILQIGPADVLGVNLSHETFARGGRSYDLAVGAFEGLDPAEVAWYIVTLQEYAMPPGGLLLVINPPRITGTLGWTLQVTPERERC
jgi:hypothetical protein